MNSRDPKDRILSVMTDQEKLNDLLKLPERIFATKIKGRVPEYKVHLDFGKAKNAVGYELIGAVARGGTIYEFVNGSWEIVYDIAPGTSRDDLPWRKK